MSGVGSDERRIKAGERRGQDRTGQGERSGGKWEEKGGGKIVQEGMRCCGWNEQQPGTVIDPSRKGDGYDAIHPLSDQNCVSMREGGREGGREGEREGEGEGERKGRRERERDPAAAAAASRASRRAVGRCGPRLRAPQKRLPQAP
jgi:hypothetical protein